MGRIENKLIGYLSLVKPEAVPVDKVIAYTESNDLSVKAFIKETVWNRVIPQVFSNIQYIEREVSNPFLTTVKKELLGDSRNLIGIIDKSKYVSAIQNTIKDILQIGDNVVFFKGAMIYNLYLSYTKSYRQMSDIDVLFPESSAFYNFLASIRNLGYDIGKKVVMQSKPLIFSKCGESQIRLTSIELLYVTFYPMVGGSRKKIDVKLCNSLFLPVHLLLKRKIKTSLEGLDFWTVSWEDAVYILVAHLMAHGCIRLHWINDLYLLSTKLSLDWEYILRLFSQKGMLPLFYSLLEYIVERYKEYSIVSNIIQAHPKYFSQCSKSRISQLLFNPDTRSKPYTIFFIQAEGVRKRGRHWIVAWIVQSLLLFKLLHSYIPMWFVRLLKKIKGFMIIPLQIKIGRPRKVPLNYYEDYSHSDGYPKEENSCITVTWSKKRGFRVKLPFLTLSQC